MDSFIINVLLIFVGSLLLIRAATMVVQSISVLGAYVKLSEFTISFVLMGFVTSVPELLVAASAAMSNNGTLALGTAIGSNITDLTLIIAIPTLLANGLHVRSIIARNDILYMSAIAMAPIILLLDSEISRSDGILLIALYGVYLIRLGSQRSHFSSDVEKVGHKKAFRSLLSFIMAVLILFASSQFIVYGSTNIATLLAIPVVIVGLIIVSAGTSLPELAHGLRAVKLNHDRQILGDVLGSVVANSTIVLAIAALISPIHIMNMDTILTSVGFLIITIILFIFGVYSNKKLENKEALVLLVIYIVFIVTELSIELIHKAFPY